jgi:hypothetical protein
MTEPSNPVPGGETPNPLPVTGLPGMGSAPLAAALAAGDVEAIGRALRLDYVVVPLLRREDGATEIQVFGTAGATPESPAWELCLFSSTEAFATFVGDAPGSEFGLQPGSSLAPFLTEHVDFLSAVTFDPSSPHAITASPAAVLAILEPRPEDDDVEWAASGADDAANIPSVPVGESADATSPGDPSEPAGSGKSTESDESRVIGFDLPLANEWLPINLRDTSARDAQIATLLQRQVGTIEAAPAVRTVLAEWIAGSSAQAAEGGAKFLAYLLQNTTQGPLALNVALYWQQLGPATSDISHLDRVGGTLHNSLSDGEQLLEADTPDGPLLRHTHIAEALGEPGAGAAHPPLLQVDFWLEFPDHRGMCLIAFSSPQLAQADQLLAFADGIVSSGLWVRDTPVD